MCEIGTKCEGRKELLTERNVPPGVVDFLTGADVFGLVEGIGKGEFCVAVFDLMHGRCYGMC